MRPRQKVCPYCTRLIAAGDQDGFSDGRLPCPACGEHSWPMPGYQYRLMLALAAYRLSLAPTDREAVIADIRASRLQPHTLSPTGTG